jgi:single-strand DNA-binding protein
LCLASDQSLRRLARAARKGQGIVNGFNQVILLGRLCAAPEQLQTKGGKLYVKATVAVTAHKKNSDGASEEQTSLIPVIIFGWQAEVFAKYVAKGDMVHLAGRLDSNEWTAGSGEKRLSLSFIIEQICLLPNGRGAGSADSSRPRRKEMPVGRPKATDSAPIQPNTEPPRQLNYNEHGKPDDLPF